MRAEVSPGSVPSNYGNWNNLTEGYSADMGDNLHKMQVEISGDVIHLCWGEFNKDEYNRYRIWYRRSPDLGKTWEEPKVMFRLYVNDYLVTVKK